MDEQTNIAEEVVKKIDSKLECSLCLEKFKEPKLLPCFHTYCKSPCLEKLVVQGPEGQSLTCPICRHHVTLPDNGVADLQTDFHIEHLFEIRESLEKAKKSNCENCKKSIASKFCQQCKKMMCNECTETHQNWGDFSDHVILGIHELKADAANVLSAKKVLRCEKHSVKKLKMYCNTCLELVCSNCVIGLHKDHNLELVEEGFPRHKEELITSLEHFKGKLNQVQQALKMFHTRAKEINDQKTTFETQIHTEIDKLHQLLDQRRAELVAQLNVSVQKKLKELAAQKDLVETTQTKMSSCLEYAEAGLETGTEGEVMRMKAPVLRRIDNITAEFDLDAIQPKTEADIELVTDEQAHKACQEFGDIVCGPVSADNSFTIGDGTSFATVGTETGVGVRLITRKNEEYLDLDKVDLKAELAQAMTTATSECSVKKEKGRPTISHLPVNRGRHSLHITVNGRHIRGSPYPIAVTPSLESLQKPAKVLRSLNKPYGIAVNSKGYMIVAERGKYCITVLSPEGEKILSFGTQGLGNGQFKFPCGVTVDQDDNIYVVDVSSDRIQKFTSGGNFIAAIGKHGSSKMEFIRPVGICFNRTNQLLYVCDESNHRIQVIATDLTFVKSFGFRGEWVGQFSFPQSLAFDSSDNLHVTDFGNHRVQVFTAEGEFLRAFIYKGNNGAKIQNPQVIAIDSSDMVYVSESHKNCVSAFTSQGKYVTSFGTKGSKEGQYNNICGLYVDQNDYIIVSDSLNNRLQML